MSHKEWREFFDHKNYKISPEWPTILSNHISRAGVTCAINFDYHHLRLKGSRKINSAFFNAVGHCQTKECPVFVRVAIDDESKTKHLYPFSLAVSGNPNHKESRSRQLTGRARAEMGRKLISSVYKITYSIFVGELMHDLGLAATYEHNVRVADKNQLESGNFTAVPPTEVLKKIRQEYEKQFLLDEDIFKAVRMFRFMSEYLDKESKLFKGKLYGFIVKVCVEL
jgi:hypothetical protein